MKALAESLEDLMSLAGMARRNLDGITFEKVEIVRQWWDEETLPYLQRLVSLARQASDTTEPFAIRTTALKEIRSFSVKMDWGLSWFDGEVQFRRGLRQIFEATDALLAAIDNGV